MLRQKGLGVQPATGEPTRCRGGQPHEWLPRDCNCGPNDRRKGDRRAKEGADSEPVAWEVKHGNYVELWTARHKDRAEQQALSLREAYPGETVTVRALYSTPQEPTDG